MFPYFFLSHHQMTWFAGGERNHDISMVYKSMNMIRVNYELLIGKIESRDRARENKKKLNDCYGGVAMD